MAGMVFSLLCCSVYKVQFVKWNQERILFCYFWQVLFKPVLLTHHVRRGVVELASLTSEPPPVLAACPPPPMPLNLLWRTLPPVVSLTHRHGA